MIILICKYTFVETRTKDIAKASKNNWVPIRCCSCFSAVPKELMVSLSHDTTIYQNFNAFDLHEKEQTAYLDNLKTMSINENAGDGEKHVYENLSDITNRNIYPISMILVKNIGKINRMSSFFYIF